MIRAMVFIDGTWLWANSSRIGVASGRDDFKVDYAKLPRALAAEVNRSLSHSTVDIARVYLFGSYPDNCDPADAEAVRRQRDFLHMLKEEFHYEVTLFPIDFRGRRVRRADRAPEDEFEPREKCVDISLATSMLYLAALPHAYDIAIAVIGDRDFVPVLQRVRDLAKRVAIASIRGACAHELWSPRDEARVKDYDVIWLDEIAGEIELRYEPHLLRCESTSHVGDRKVWTTYRPRKNQKFRCDRCREEHATHRESPGGNGAPDYEEVPDVPPNQHTVLRGLIVRVIPDKGYGFIRGEDQIDYFFHLSDIVPGATFGEMAEDDEVVFEVKKQPPAPGENGAARRVRPRTPTFTSR